MFKNYLKIAWRSLRSNRIYSAINIAGLATGLAVCIAITAYVWHEYHYDSFHLRGDRIVEVQADSHWSDQVFQGAGMAPAVGPQSKRQIPEVEDFVRWKTEEPAVTVQREDKPSMKFSESEFVFADSNFFSFFSFPLVQGNPQAALREPYSVVLTAEMAKKYFGTENPLGKRLLLAGKYSFMITGIARHIPSYSSIRFGFIAATSSFAGMDRAEELKGSGVSVGGFHTCLLLHSQTDAPKVDRQLTAMARKTFRPGSSVDIFHVVPLRQVHFSGANQSLEKLKYLRLFPWVAVLILLLALTNYISLATARAGLRAKEIGVRKVMGANRRSIAWQFLVESALFTAIAFGLGLVIFYILQRPFFRFVQLSPDADFLFNPGLLWSLFALYMITLFLAGSYPSLLLSAYQPVQVLYGKLSRQTGGLSVRKFFTIFQFSVAIILSICGLVIHRQVSFFRNTYTGVDRENVLNVPYSETTAKSLAAVRAEISRIPGVLQTSIDHHKMYAGTDLWAIKSAENPKDIALSAVNVDQTFIPMLNLKWVTPPDDPNFDKQGGIILNEAAMQALNLQRGKLHQVVTFGDHKMEVAGIVRDFNFTSLQYKVSPMLLSVSPQTDSLWTGMDGYLMVKLGAHINLPTTIARIRNSFEAYDGLKDFSYSFLDEDFGKLYREEQNLADLFLTFVSLTLFMAGIGLFGLVTFMTSQRIKEIGIRKVLGASVRQIVHLLTLDFFKLILLAFVIACPIAWVLMNNWLRDFAFRIEMKWWMLAICGAGTIGIALLTMGYQSVKSALASPVRSLRSE